MEWISVKEKMPPKGVDILAWQTTLNPLASGIVTGRFSVYDEGKFWSYSSGMLWDAHHVTHWIPLPEPPKEEIKP